MPEIAWYSLYDGGISLPAFSGICLSGLDGPYLWTFGRGGAWGGGRRGGGGVEVGVRLGGLGVGGPGIGVVHCADGICLNCRTDYTFHARSYHDCNLPIIQASPSVSSLMSLPNGLTSHSLEKEVH